MARKRGKMDGMEVDLASCVLYYDSEELTKFFSIFDDISSDQWMVLDGIFSLFVGYIREWFGKSTPAEIDDMEPETRKQSMIDFALLCNKYRPNADDVELFDLWMEKVSGTNVPMLLADDVLNKFIWERYKEAVEKLDKADIPFKDKLAVHPKAPKAIANKGIIHIDEIQLKGEDGVQKYTTGVKDLDKIVRLEDGNSVIIGARPGVGKSLFMLQMAISNAENGIKSLYLSLEMTEEQLNERLINYCSGRNVRMEYVDDNNHLDFEGYSEAVDKIKSTKHFRTIAAYLDLYVTSESSADRIFVELEDKIKKYGYKLICIDYLQLLRFVDLDEWASIRAATKAIKNLSIRNKIITVSGSQVSRASVERGLYLSDLFGGQTIEADADIIIGMEETRERNSGPKAVINNKVMKNRNGDRGEQKYLIDYPTGHMEITTQ